jgi:transcriptional regulator with XRE-family HTH domain
MTDKEKPVPESLPVSRRSSSRVPSAEQQAFARALKARRMERVVGLRTAAAEMGVSASTVSRWEHGHVDPAVLRAFAWLRRDLEVDDYVARAEEAEQQLERLRRLITLTTGPEDHHG